MKRISGRSKYRAVKVRKDGITFDSKAEYYRYLQLKDMERRGEIFGLKVHDPFVILCGFNDYTGKWHGDTHYEADFSYRRIKDDKLVAEDVKGKPTELYKLKKKLFLSFYRAIEFHEIPASTLYRRR